MTVTIFERHLEWLNRRFQVMGINRSVSVREALELLIAKYGAEGVASSSSEVSDDLDAIAPRSDDVKYEAPEVILTQDDAEGVAL